MAKAKETSTAVVEASVAAGVGESVESRLARLEELERDRRQKVTPKAIQDSTAALKARMKARLMAGGKHLWNIVKVVRVDERGGRKVNREVRHEYWTDLDGSTEPRRVVNEWRQRSGSQYTGEHDPHTAEMIRESARPENWDEPLRQ